MADIFDHLLYNLNYDIAIIILKLVHTSHLKLVHQQIKDRPLNKMWIIRNDKQGFPITLYKDNPYHISKNLYYINNNILLFQGGYWITFTEIRDWKRWWIIKSPYNYFYTIKVAKRLHIAKPYLKKLLISNKISYPKNSSVEDLCEIIMKKLN